MDYFASEFLFLKYRLTIFCVLTASQFSCVYMELTYFLCLKEHLSVTKNKLTNLHNGDLTALSNLKVSKQCVSKSPCNRLTIVCHQGHCL